MTDTRNFNSRTYTRCDFFHTVDGGNPANFNSRTYTRCDSRLKQIMDEKNNFNSRTYTRCDKIPPSRKNLNPKFQFTHLHEVRPYELDELSKSIMISIHAPTRGATVTIRDYNADTTISIHAPTRGATEFTCYELERDKFQFTHLHEVRPAMMVLLSGLYPHFNSRTYTRCDGSIMISSSSSANFNSRTYTRCDSSPKNPLSQAPNSYHFANHKIIPFSQLKFLYQHLSFIGQISIAKIPTFFCSLSLRN